MNWFERNIHCFPSVPWSHNWERQHELIYRMAGMARRSVTIHRPYGLINHGIGTIWKKFRQEDSRLQAAQENKRRPNMAFVSPWFVPFHYIPPVDAFNRWLVTRQTGFCDEDMVFATYANGFTLQMLSRAPFSVLDLAQRRQKTPGLSQKARDTERRAVEKANIVFTDSITTLRDYEGYRNNIIHLPTGVNYHRFQTDDREDTLLELRGRYQGIAGYAGTDLAVDVSTLRYWIEQHPPILFVLVGRFRRAEMLALQTMPNVRMPGLVRFDDLPRWLNTFDIGLIPYVLNERNMGVFPTKFLEYAAAGLPVVSSALPDVAACKVRFAHIYRSAEEGSEQLAQLIKQPERLQQDARDFALLHDWESKFSTFAAHLQSALK